MNEEPVSIIRNFYQIYGKSSLIFTIKAELFYNKKYAINKEIFFKVFNIIKVKHIDFIPTKELRNLLFIVCYFLYPYSEEAKTIFQKKFIKSFTKEDKEDLFFLYNLIEY